MTRLSEILHKIHRKWMKVRLQPIRVFCLHHVCENYDKDTMYYDDWMQIDEFKNKVQTMQQDGVEFISLSEAYKHICEDYFRSPKYAVLTFDDGWATLNHIIPWLCEQNIPLTLFINPSFLLGEDRREKGTSITISVFNTLLKGGKGKIQVASHGWNHKFCPEMTMPDFETNVEKCETFLSGYDQYVPFFAYPCGRHNLQLDKLLLSKGIIPVLMDGVKNYNDVSAIHRELLV